MPVSPIDRLDERNYVGLCHLDVVDVKDVASMPDDVGGNVVGDVVLNEGASWSRIYLEEPGGLFRDAWKMEKGAQLSAATITGTVSKDRLLLMPILWKLKHGRYLVRMQTRNGPALLMGRPESGAAGQCQQRSLGEDMVSDQNGYQVTFALSNRWPVPYHNGTVPDPPITLGQLEAMSWAAIEALLTEGQLDDAEASLCTGGGDVTIQLVDSASDPIGSADVYPAGTITTKTAPDGSVQLKDSAGTNIGSAVAVKSNGTEDAPVPQIAIPYKDASNVSQVIGGLDALYVSGSLRPDAEVPRRPMTLNGVSSGQYVTLADLLGGSVPDVVSVDLTSTFHWAAAGHDTTTLFTVPSGGYTIGSYTAITDSGSNGTITVSKNGGSFVAFSGPLTLGAGDTIQFRRTTYTAAGWVRITGTYTP